MFPSIDFGPLKFCPIERYPTKATAAKSAEKSPRKVELLCSPRLEDSATIVVPKSPIISPETSP